MNDLRARVFISCGQNKQSDELRLALAIQAKLMKLGFDAYVAVGEQTLHGLKENIFERLRQSEYFLFVDFKRERLSGKKRAFHRGSLFSHQELAIASLLELDVLAFQESGTDPRDGILGFIQGNAISFSDRTRLPNLVSTHVRKRIREGKWNPGWRNELVLERDSTEFTDPVIRNTGEVGRFFHIGVRNRHRTKTALNCCAYLQKVTSLDSGSDLSGGLVEFKWEGYLLPNAHIHARTARRFDAFFIVHNEPAVLRFNAFCDAPQFLPNVQGTGTTYKLTYLVLADNFPPSRASFVVRIGNSLDETTLE
jgi:hypothetical protein